MLCLESRCFFVYPSRMFIEGPGEGRDGGDAGESSDEGDDQAGPSYRIHQKNEPKYVTLKLPVKELREETSKMGNRRQLSLPGQTEFLSDVVLRGGGDLKDVPCSTTTMHKYIHTFGCCCCCCCFRRCCCCCYCG